MKNDREIKERVLEELLHQKDIDETQIGVIVENGVVTLTGVVDHVNKKAAALRALENVKGIKAIVKDIKIKYGTDYKTCDKEIAKSITNTLEQEFESPNCDITVEVQDGFVFLLGKVRWDFQRQKAKKIAEQQLGVKGVINNLDIKQKVFPNDVKTSITKAFGQMALIDANSISVDVKEQTVILRGKVKNFAQKQEASISTYNVPGVQDVVNELEVSY